MRALAALVLLAGCYVATAPPGECPDIGLECGGILCEHQPSGALYQVGVCPVDGCGPVVVDGAEYLTTCMRNGAGTADVCALMCSEALQGVAGGG